ncbi:MAG: metallophosphoesterase [Nanoarchaeota archaeon]|nr:metallophosphoesterase [Nanoarchaeota archaeon]
MEIKELSKGIFAIDLALYLKKSKILVLADTHIGYEESLNKQGVLIPRFQFNEIGHKLEKIFSFLKEKNFEIEKVLINGDIKHEFGRISEQEWRHTLQLIDFLSKHANEIILIKGNHDTVLGPIAEKRNIIVKEHAIIDNILLIHGDSLPNKALEKELKGKKVSAVIIGHEHPAVSLGTMARFEKYKCFLVGEWNKRMLIVQPSFNLVTEGTDIVKESLLSPFLKSNKKFADFKVIVVGEDLKFYDFGSIAKIRKMK